MIGVALGATEAQATDRSQPLPCVRKLVADLFASMPPKQRWKQDLITWSDELKVGDSLYVDPKRFHKIPELNLKRTAGPPLKLTVVKAADPADADAMMTVESPETGPVRLKSFKLNGSYAHPDYKKRADFEIGEIVGIDTIDKKDGYFWAVELERSDQTVELQMDAKPMGKVVAKRGEDYIVSVRVKAGDRVDHRHLLVKPNDLIALAAGTPDKFRENIRPILDIQLTFANGEKVRFRDNKGLMREGKYAGAQDARLARIVDEQGHGVVVRKESVFKQSGDSPAKTPHYSIGKGVAEFEAPEGPLRELLDGAALLTSHPDFAAMEQLDKIRLLYQYTQRNLPWTEHAIHAENLGFSTLNDLVCAGAGVCRHLSPVLSAILSEAGFETRVAKHVPPPPATVGHAWLEVDMKRPDGSIETFVVDPSTDIGEEMIAPWSQIKEWADKDPNSAAKLWYTQPDREYLHR